MDWENQRMLSICIDRGMLTDICWLIDHGVDVNKPDLYVSVVHNFYWLDLYQLLVVIIG
jgi:hypothetical protein